MPKQRANKTQVFHHASRYEIYEEEFMRFLGRKLPKFKPYPKAVRLALCGMIDDSQSRYRSHLHHDGYAWFTWKELEQAFGRKGFTAINEQLGLFDVLEHEGRQSWSSIEGSTKAYRLSDEVRDIHEGYLNACLNRRRATNLCTPDTKTMRAVPANAIAAKNKDGNTRRGFKESAIKAAVPVNMVQVKKLIRDYEGMLLSKESSGFQLPLLSAPPDMKYLKQLKLEALAIYSRAHNNVCRGKIPHGYEESQSGRLYAMGSVNLQNCRRVLRETAMVGLYDLDIENCHYSILKQMAAANGYQCTAVTHYLNNKASVRQGLSDKFGITKQQAKDTLIALIYGARFSHRPQDALPKILKSHALALEIYQDEVLKDLAKDIAGARKAILDAQPISRGKITNCLGLTFDLDGSTDGQQLAHLMQGVEAMALSAAVDLYPESIVLLQHDGFTSTIRLDAKRIEQAIFAKTGYRFEIAQTAIQVNSDSAFDAHPEQFQNQLEK